MTSIPARLLAACLGVILLATVTVVATHDPNRLDQVVATQATVAVPAVIEETPGVGTVDDKAAQIERHANLVRFYRNAKAAEAERVRLAAEEAARVAAEQAAAVERARAERAARQVAAAPAAPVETYQRRAGNCGGWEGLIAAYFPGEVAKACSVMMCESGGSPTIHNRSSSASGLWQFLDSTWRSTTGTPGPAANYSAETQTAAAAKLRNSSGWGQWSCA